MKVLRWIGVVLVIIIAGIVGKLVGNTAGREAAEASLEKQQFYAISKAKSQKTGRTIVSVILTSDRKDCKPLLAGRRDEALKPNNPMTIESEQCVSDISGDWLLAFNNKPVGGAYYVAYTNVVWPTRELYFDLDSRIPSAEVCKVLVNLYKSIDNNVQCVPPSTPNPSR
jgi:hypothetical protein